MLTREDLQAISNLFMPRFDAIDKKFDTMNGRMNRLEIRMDRMEERMDHMEDDISALKYGQAELRKGMKRCNERIDEVYDLALHNFGQIEESKTRLNLLECHS